ncbi:uncharacterized protein V6R79_007699 [Siganus canaliculatus]
MSPSLVQGEFSFEQDSLVEGGQFGPMTNGTDYREVRQYRSDHHLLRFYFLTRIYSPYMESILEDFRRGLKPDFIIVSSCVWDITRYGPGRLDEYKENLHRFFSQIRSVVCCDCLILWSLAMPLGKRIRGGFLVPEVSYLSSVLCHDVIEANFYSNRLARAYGLDVLDLHFHFRLSLQHRMPDSIHWDALAHRRISSLLLQHAAHAWGVDLPHLPASAPRQGAEQILDPGGSDPRGPVQGPRWAQHHATDKSRSSTSRVSSETAGSVQSRFIQVDPGVACHRPLLTGVACHRPLPTGVACLRPFPTGVNPGISTPPSLATVLPLEAGFLPETIISPLPSGGRGPGIIGRSEVREQVLILGSILISEQAMAV